MRNLILIAVAAVAFCVVGIAHPNVLIAQDFVEEDLESDRPVTRNRPDRGEDVQDRRETFRDRGEDVSDRREDRRDRREDYRDRGEDVTDRREDRHDRGEDYRDRRGDRRDRREDQPAGPGRGAHRRRSPDRVH